MKNVYIIDDHSSSICNGIGSYIRELIYCLKNINVNINVIACNHTTNKFNIIKEDGIMKFLIPVVPGFFFQNDKLLVSLLKLHIEDSYDNIFFINHSPCDLFLQSLKKSFPLSKRVFVIHDMGWTWRLLGDTDKLKEIVSTIDSLETIKRYKDLIDYFEAEQRMYNSVNKVIVLANETENLLNEVYKINNSKLTIIPNGLRDTYTPISQNEIHLLKSKLCLNSEEKIILYTGRINEIKGIYALINCFKSVLKIYPNSRLVVIGTIFCGNVPFKLARDISTKITFTGQLPSDYVQNWYKIADIGILASYLEQCSYTGIEMMMHGLPIVASNGFCVKDMFQKDNACIASIGDRTNIEEFENNLANAILELLNSQEQRSLLSRSARASYESTYTIETMQNKYHQLLDMLTTE